MRDRLLGIVFFLACGLGHSEVPTIKPTPQQLFAGSSEGNGALEFLFGESRSFHVESHGVSQPDGSFRLDQTITFDGKPPSSRHWIIRTVRPGEYAGTLSDAAGEVSGRINGKYLTLRYRIKGLFVMHQKLTLLPDFRTIDNLGEITLLGIPIGRLHETISRNDPAVRQADVED